MSARDEVKKFEKKFDFDWQVSQMESVSSQYNRPAYLVLKTSEGYFAKPFRRMRKWDYDYWTYTVREEQTGFKPARLLNGPSIFVDTEGEPLDPNKLLKEENPFAYECFSEHVNAGFKAWHFLLAPQLEQLIKANFAFAQNAALITNYPDQFNRLTQPGKNLKEIFKTPKSIYNTLKDKTDLKVWDMARKLNKLAGMDASTVARLIDAGFTEKEMELLEYCLKYRHEDKLLFSLDSLLNYLDRLDMFQALSRREGLNILRDYMQLCRALGVKPNVDSDSLKREHDVAARNLRLKRDEIQNEKFIKAQDRLTQFDYSEDIFFVRGFRTYDDLLDEAKQQHNCVAGYAQSMLKGSSTVYTMRQVASPDKALITVEIRKENSRWIIAQKYMAYNQPVRNKAQSEFLDRWVRWINNGAIKKEQKAEPTIVECDDNYAWQF